MVLVPLALGTTQVPRGTRLWPQSHHKSQREVVGQFGGQCSILPAHSLVRAVGALDNDVPTDKTEPLYPHDLTTLNIEIQPLYKLS